MILKPTEAQFQSQILQLARIQGWRVFGVAPALTSAGRHLTPFLADGKGWPDLFMVKEARVLAPELKVGRNKPTPEQLAWIAALRGAGIPSDVWYPRDWDRIEELLCR